MERERSLPISNAYDSMSVPEIPPYIDYSQAPVLSPAEDRKPIPLTTGTSPPNSHASAQAQPTNNNFLHDGKYSHTN